MPCATSATRILGRLAGQRVHEVEVDVAEDLQRGSRGDARLGVVVYAAERLEKPRVEALHAQRQPVDAGRPEAGEFLLLEGSGVGFERDLGVGCKRDTRAHRREHRDRSPIAENRLGVPPPMNTVVMRRPQIDGSANSRSAISAST